jgi:hypothetical protein
VTGTNFSDEPEFPTYGPIEFVAVQGAYAYVAGSSCGGGYLQIINVSDPANPASLGQFQFLASIAGLAVSGNYAYIAEGLQAHLLQFRGFLTKNSWKILDFACI